MIWSLASTLTIFDVYIYNFMIFYYIYLMGSTNGDTSWRLLFLDTEPRLGYLSASDQFRVRTSSGVAQNGTRSVVFSVSSAGLVFNRLFCGLVSNRFGMVGKLLATSPKQAQKQHILIDPLVCKLAEVGCIQETNSPATHV